MRSRWPPKSFSPSLAPPDVRLARSANCASLPSSLLINSNKKPRDICQRSIKAASDMSDDDTDWNDSKPPPEAAGKRGASFAQSPAISSKVSLTACHAPKLSRCVPFINQCLEKIPVIRPPMRQHFGTFNADQSQAIRNQIPPFSCVSQRQTEGSGAWLKEICTNTDRQGAVRRQQAFWFGNRLATFERATLRGFLNSTRFDRVSVCNLDAPPRDLPRSSNAEQWCRCWHSKHLPRPQAP